MKINILLPYKEKFDQNKASSVSITVRNNLYHSKYLNQIKVFGQNIDNPLFKDNFIGLKYSILSFQSKNRFLASKMIEIISEENDDRQLIEIHNRPYLVDQIAKGDEFPISLFFHNDPQTMNGSKSIKDRENLLKKCTAIFCVSKYIRALFLEGITKNYDNVHVLYNGVSRKLKKFPFKKKEVIFVGRLVKEKGAHIYVNSIKSIAHHYPEWDFGLIGSFRLGNNNNENSYAKSVIREFKSIGPQAHFYGFKDHDFVEAKMKSASIIIIPSIWQEPFGLVVAEAMSNGVAVIASKVGGIPEILKDNGILIENLNSENLEKALLDLIENEKKRKLLQKKSWKNFRLFSSCSSKKLDKFRQSIVKDYF